VRGRGGHPARLGAHVLVGPHAHVNGATIEDEVFLATGVSVFPGASVGRGSEVRVGAVVHVNSTLAPGTTVPIGWVAAGDPAELFSPDRHEELWAVQERMDFPGTVFGMSREEATMERVAAATRRASAGTAAIASCEHRSRDPDRARRPLADHDRLFRARRRLSRLARGHAGARPPQPQRSLNAVTSPRTTAPCPRSSCSPRRRRCDRVRRRTPRCCRRSRSHSCRA
jgi:hypothetical protein